MGECLCNLEDHLSEAQPSSRFVDRVFEIRHPMSRASAFKNKWAHAHAHTP